MRSPILVIPILVFSLLTLSVPSANAQTPRVVAFASASGGLALAWVVYPGLTAITQGSGIVMMSVQGEVEAGPGVYYFDTLQVSVRLKASWAGSDGTSYQLMAKVAVPLAMASRGTVSGDAHPDVGAFIIFSVSFKGFLVINGVKSSLNGMSKIWALTPETSFQLATGRYLAVRLESGPYSFVLGWSEAPQTVGGVPLPEADRYFQRVRLIT